MGHAGMDVCAVSITWSLHGTSFIKEYAKQRFWEKRLLLSSIHSIDTYMYYMRISMVTMSLEQRRCLFIRLSSQQVDNNA